MHAVFTWTRFAFVVAFFTVSTAFAAPRRYAVVVGPTSEPAVVRNVKTLAETFADLGFNVVALCDSAVEFESGSAPKTLPPTKENIETIFEKGGPLKLRRDSVLVVYYVGGVAENAEGDALFVARNGELASVRAFREAASRTPCEKRALFVDAWLENGVKVDADVRARVERWIAGGEIATTAALEKRGASVASYWLNEGLLGNADGALDGVANGEIELDELFAYERENLETARTVFAASPDVETFALCEKPRRDYPRTTDDLADRVVTLAETWGVDEIVVEDFVELGASRLKDRPELAAALRSFAADATVRTRRCVEAKREKTGAKRGSGRRLVATPRVEARENERGETEFAIRCDVVSLGGEAVSTTVEASVDAADSDETLEIDRTFPTELLPKARVEARASKDEPWRERPIRRVGGESWVELNPGETYRIVVATPRDVPEPGVCMRLLVDGCNSLPQYEPYVAPAADVFGEKASSAAAPEPTPEIVVAPAVRLDEARYWLLNRGKTDAYGGFYDKSLTYYREFQVDRRGGSGESGDAENGELGTIVVAFYRGERVAPSHGRGPAGDVQTVPGPKRPCVASSVDGVESGALIRYLRWRCATPEYLESLENGASFGEPAEVGTPVGRDGGKTVASALTNG